MELEFLFDFGSPNAYLCHRVLPEIETRTGVRFAYRAVLLGGVFKLTGNASPAVALRGIKNKPEYEALEVRRFLARHAITDFRFNPHFPVNTLQLMRGAVVAERDGFLAPYVDTVFRAMWVEARKMDEPEEMHSVLDRAGFDAGAIAAATQEPDVKRKLLEDTEAAVARGVFGSPSFFVGGELFFGKDRLDDVEREIERQR